MPKPKKDIVPQRIISIKSVGDDGEGSFTGLLSPYGTVDLVRDRVMKGAFTKTIADNGGSIPILWQHDDTDPVGSMNFKDTPVGLEVHGKLLLDPDVPTAMKAYKLIKNKIIKGLSIGFRATKADDRDDDGVRNIREAKLYEGSIVTFPAAPEAQIYSVKSAERKSMDDGEGDFSDRLDMVQAACAGGQILGVLRDALCNVWWNAGYDYDGDLADDLPSMAAYAEAMFDQGKEEFLASLLKYGNLSSKQDPDDMKMISIKGRESFMERKIALSSSGPTAMEHKAAMTKKVDGEDLPASAFLIVGDPEKTATWKLPVHFSTDAKTKSHIRNALSRIGQVGQVEGVSSDDLAKAKTKLESMAKAKGIDTAVASKGDDDELVETKEEQVDTPAAVETEPTAVAVTEVKAGRKISADTAAKLRDVHMQLKSAGDSLGALYSDDDPETSESETKTAAASTPEEPVEQDHSAGPGEENIELKKLLEELAALTTEVAA